MHARELASTPKTFQVKFTSMSRNSQLTPMMLQYRRIKGDLPKDALLLFRLGDFYELFFEDAKTGAQLLNVALTKRGTTPMCGIPYHAAAGYIAKILRAGRKVAICDQVEEARQTGHVRFLVPHRDALHLVVAGNQHAGEMA